MDNFIINGNPTGDVASRLMQNNFDVNCLRPWIGQDGQSYITQNVAGKMVPVLAGNATATLRKDDWVVMDKAIIKAAQPRLRAVADLRSRGLTYSIPNGMGKTVLETETVSDITPAGISMDGLRKTTSDRPDFELSNLPLPIIHKDFHFSARQVMASRNGGSPLDTTMAELAGRSVAEAAEKLLIGSSSVTAFGGGNIYGFINYPNRLTKTMTLPTASGWTSKVAVTEVLAMRQQSQESFHYGPWILYTSVKWDQYLDADYSDSKGDNTLRQRLEQIQGVSAVRTLDYLSDYQMVLVQSTSDVVREVIGMDITTVQWETLGGMQLNYKVMAIMVPQIRCDQNSKTGIVHGVSS